MTTFITLAVLAILLVALVWGWVALRNKNLRDGKSFAGKSTIIELISKERQRHSKEQNGDTNR